MQVSVEAGDGLERRIRVALPADQIEVELDKRLKDMARTTRLAGFRPGKVPLKLIRQRYQEPVRREIIAEMVPGSFSEAIAQQALNPAGFPAIEPLIDVDAGEYGYTATFEIMPQFELVDLSGKTVERPNVDLTDDDRARVVERLREQRRTWRPVERAAQSGDRLTVDYRGEVDGGSFDGGEGADVLIDLGSGRSLPGLEDALIGAVAGEQKTVDLTIPDDHQNTAIQGRTVRFAVDVKEVGEPVLPEVDADFVRVFGIEDGDLERFERDIRVNMERELRQRTTSRIKEQVWNLLLEANPIPVPGALVRDEIKALKEQTTRDMKLGKSLELPDDLFEASARRRVTLGLLMREIVKKNNLQVDSARVRTAVEEIAASYESPDEVVRYYYADPKHLAPVESLVMEEQIVDWLLTSARVEDKAMSFQELVAAT